jgi:hypothetical protein
MGRRTGSQNKGYFFRTGRGWYMSAETLKDTDNGANVKRPKMVPLVDESGNPLRSKTTATTAIKAAYRRALIAAGKSIDDGEDSSEDGGGATVEQVCDAYLAKAKGEGAKKTYTDRKDTLYDFCYGFPAKFQNSTEKPKATDRIHKGYADKPVGKLIKKDIDDWLNEHKTWNGGRRTRVQALKRAMNYGVECGLLESNPLRGYRVSKQVARVTYLTPEQERALCKLANPAMALAIKVCIRTGARPGCEFAKLTASHVKISGDRMVWTFPVNESKTGKLRTLRITDPEIIDIVKRQRRSHRTGPIFRNTRGTPWKRETLSQAFLRAKELVVKTYPRRFGRGRNHAFDKDACMYSTRHTYAQRTLQGFWTGKQTNLETLARLMGNSPQVCREHYLNWTGSYDEPLWESA